MQKRNSDPTKGLNKDLQSSTKVSTHLAISVREFISSSPSPQFNVVYRDEVVIARLQHCWRGRGLPILAMLLGIVPQIPCQRIFVPSDPRVPKTFVVDCSLGSIFFMIYGPSHRQDP